MRSKSFIALAIILVILLVGAVGVYAYDSNREDLIAKGVTVSGIDVGGMRADQARAKLRRELVVPLSRPIVARWHGHRFKLTPRRARVGVNVDSSVDAALRRSRAGGVISRTVRGLTGARLAAAMNVQITYDERAVKRLVRRVRHSLDREPRDASVSF